MRDLLQNSARRRKSRIALPVSPSCPTSCLRHPSAPVTPDIRYRESIVALLKMDPRLPPAKMQEPPKPTCHPEPAGEESVPRVTRPRLSEILRFTQDDRVKL